MCILKENCAKFSHWCDLMDETLKVDPKHKAELGDMKTLLERYKNLDADIMAQKQELEGLQGDADQLVMWSGTESVKVPVNAFKERWAKFDKVVKEVQKRLEKEIGEYSGIFYIYMK